MKIGVVGDTHENIGYLKEAVNWLIENYQIDVIIHLGDNYDDTKILENMSIKLFRVPGVFDRHYKELDIPNRLIEEFGEWKVLITHTQDSHQNDLPSDIKPEEVIKKKEVNMVFYAHTHIPKIEEKEGILFLNPGHLKKEDKKGYSPSFGVVELFKEKAKISIIDLGTKREISSSTFYK